MIPRGAIDISWRDLLFGLGACWLPKVPAALQARVETAWSSAGDSLACLSVRSGLDLLLQALAWPAGSEVLVSAITIQDMVRILEYHGLVPVPVDLDIQTLTPSMDMLARALRPQTKAILVAHLFGSRMSLDQLQAFARQKGLLVIEDCAQAYDGSAYRGHPASDVSMFSFGPIKTQTALGGGLLCFKDRALLAKVRTIQACYPGQRWQAYGQRLLKYALIKALANRVVLGLLVWLCQLGGVDYDQLLRDAVRGFTVADLIGRIRQQPATPLLCLLERRLRHVDRRRVEQRLAFAQHLFAHLPWLRRPGECALYHTHWVLPVLSNNPDGLMHLLRWHGFDATRSASSLYIVPPPADRPELTPSNARQTLAQLLYLPIQPMLGQRDQQRLVRLLMQFATTQTDFAAAPVRSTLLS